MLPDLQTCSECGNNFVGSDAHEIPSVCPSCKEGKPLKYFQEKLQRKVCSWCQTPLGSQTIEYYDHPWGWKVSGFEERQWLYVTCPKCEYQWSLEKLGILRDTPIARF